MSWKSSY